MLDEVAVRTQRLIAGWPSHPLEVVVEPPPREALPAECATFRSAIVVYVIDAEREGIVVTATRAGRAVPGERFVLQKLTCLAPLLPDDGTVALTVLGLKPGLRLWQVSSQGNSLRLV